jgi:UPF0755 protein
MKQSYHPGYGGRKPKKKSRKYWWFFILILILSGSIWYAYQLFYATNVYIVKDQEKHIDIPTGSSFDDVKKLLYSNGYIIHRKDFEFVAKLKKYDLSIKPGRYILSPQMGNMELIDKLRAGNQDPIKVTFNSVRYADQLAGRIAKQIEADSLSLILLMKDTAFLDSMGVDPSSLFTIMIPNTYEFYWNTNARQFISRMKVESDRFWGDGRDEKLKDLNLSRLEAMTLASIVEKETNKNDEKATIAGVYLNRLKYGWLLEADPTLVFAHGNFEIKRVLNIYKEIDSPYNTYKNPGLPPGPICLPSVSSIDAASAPEQHNYMFFCAREYFSGYHSFAATIDQHNVNAWKYQQALNKRRIMK